MGERAMEYIVWAKWQKTSKIGPKKLKTDCCGPYMPVGVTDV